ncbi:MAG: serine hydrolase [Armatimonadota bacterium]
MTALDRKQFLLGTGSLVWAGAQLSRLRVESPSALRRDLEAIVADEIARCGIPAVSLSIFGEGMSSIDIAVGRRCQGQSGEVTTNDAFQIGSTTKIFTALALARLHDRKRLDWNETLRSAFSDLPRLHPDYARLSLKHLLSHRSGMMRDFDPDFALPLPTGESRERRWSFAALALAAPPATAAGKYSYSSTGFICLGALMEKKLGIPWFELVRREVLDPLRIVGSVSGPPLDTGGKLIVAGHAKEAKGRLIPLLPPFRGRYASDLIDPAGGIWMPIREFGKLARAISANRDAMGTYLGAETYRDYLSFPFGGSYGLGLRREFRGFAGGNALGHYGTYMGFENHFFFSASKRCECRGNNRKPDPPRDRGAVRRASRLAAAEKAGYPGATERLGPRCVRGRGRNIDGACGRNGANRHDKDRQKPMEQSGVGRDLPACGRSDVPG